MDEPLLIIRDEDIFGITSEIADSEYDIRTTVKVILFDNENKVALVGTKYRLLPGGGVEEDETLEDAAARECMEEVGCHVVVEGGVGMIEEYRAKVMRHQVTHCFVARVVGDKGIPTTTQADEQGMHIEWMPIADAYDFLERQLA